MSTSTRRFLLSLLCLLLLSSYLVACGSTPSSNANATSNMTLNVGQINDSVNFFPFYVAEQQGYFKAQGLTLAARPRLQTGAKVVTALEAGSIDIGGGVITDAFDIAKADSSFKIIGALTNGYVVDVVVGKKFEQATHLTEASSLASKVLALRGKKIGITGSGSGTEALIVYLFKQEGLNAQKDATLVNLGSNETGALAALQTGRVDALSFFSPIGQAAEAQGIGNILISPERGDIPGLRGDIHGVFYTRQSTINNRSKAVQAFIRAVAQAETYIQQNPSQARTLLNNYLKLGQQVTDTTYTATAPVWAPNPQISQAAYNVASQFHVQAGLIKAAPPYSSLVATNTINSALKS